MSDRPTFGGGMKRGSAVNAPAKPAGPTPTNERQTFNPQAFKAAKAAAQEQAKIIQHAAAGSGLVPSWSASTLKDYEKCPYSTYLKKVEKVQEEQHPAAARGNAIHALAEWYVTGDENVMEDSFYAHQQTWDEKIYPKWRTQFDDLQQSYTDAKVECEGEWGFDKDWGVTGWTAPNVWGRMKLDALLNESESSVKVIDYKTGKKFGNEISHADQGMIYAVGTFMRYEHVEFAEVEFWYLDHQETTTQRYAREQAMNFLPRITDRATILTSDTQFKPKPSKNNCRWCIGNKTDTCEWRVE